MSKTKNLIIITSISIALFLLCGYIASLFLSKDVLAIIYKIINFIAVMLVIKYLFQTVQLPVIKEQLAQKFSFFRGLEEKFKNLKEQNIIAQKEINDQDKLFENLKTKISIWTRSRKLQWEEKQVEIQKINSTHQKRIEIQTQNIHQLKLIKEVFPRVINNTSQQLKQKFAKNQESKIFLKDIISYMQKNTKKEFASEVTGKTTGEIK